MVICTKLNLLEKKYQEVRFVFLSQQNAILSSLVTQ